MNYREKFKKYYNIDFSKEYEIHHIDLNHDNDDISNLMILPKELHSAYHRCVEEAKRYSKIQDKYNISFDCRIFGNQLCSNCLQLESSYNLINVLYECSKWYDYKKYLDGEIPNIHRIELKNSK